MRGAKVRPAVVAVPFNSKGRGKPEKISEEEGEYRWIRLDNTMVVILVDTYMWECMPPIINEWRRPSKIIFSEKNLSVHVCLSVPSRPIPVPIPFPLKKPLNQKTLLNKVVRYTTRVTKIHLESCCSAGRGKVELRIYGRGKNGKYP